MTAFGGLLFDRGEMPWTGCSISVRIIHSVWSPVSPVW